MQFRRSLSNAYSSTRIKGRAKNAAPGVLAASHYLAARKGGKAELVDIAQIKGLGSIAETGKVFLDARSRSGSSSTPFWRPTTGA